MAYKVRQLVVSTVITVAALAALAGAAQAQVRVLYSNYNGAAVGNGSFGQPTFTLPTATEVTDVTTYHWNGGRGAAPGQIMLRNVATRATYGWISARLSGDTNQTATFNVAIPAGTYEVLDSGIRTWSSNAQSGGRGFVKVYGFPISFIPGGGGPSQPSNPAPTAPARPVTPSAPVTPRAPASPYPFTVCSGNSNPVAVVGIVGAPAGAPCTVRKGTSFNVFEVRAGITPSGLSLTGSNGITLPTIFVSRVNGSLYSATLPLSACSIVGATSPGYQFRVTLLDTTGTPQGQIGVILPDCR